MSPPPPRWRLPPGVDPALWDYACSDRLADEEAAYFADDPLTRTDQTILSSRFDTPGTLIDLGSGAGRLSIAFARRGFRVVAVDLSEPMLRAVGRAAASERLSIGWVRANLCRLEGLPDARFDHALMMYSTLGMIAGTDARRLALASAARVLKPGGRLAVHAHNLWLNLHDPQGRRWLIGQAARALAGRTTGDRTMSYRGIPGVTVHLYRRGELRRDLIAAGFAIDEIVPLHAVSAQVLRWPRILSGLRAGGWIVFAHRR